jgi:hypothetical protein
MDERRCEVDRQATHLCQTFRPQLDMVSETKGATTCSFSAHVCLRGARRGTLWSALMGSIRRTDVSF